MRIRTLASTYDLKVIPHGHSVPATIHLVAAHPAGARCRLPVENSRHAFAYIFAGHGTFGEAYAELDDGTFIKQRYLPGDVVASRRWSYTRRPCAAACPPPSASSVAMSWC